MFQEIPRNKRFPTGCKTPRCLAVHHHFDCMHTDHASDSHFWVSALNIFVMMIITLSKWSEKLSNIRIGYESGKGIHRQQKEDGAICVNRNQVHGDSEEARNAAIQTIALAWGESAAESVASQDLVQFMPETVRGNAMSCTPLNTSSMFTEEHQPRQP